jgi:hypothetical protein
MNITVNHILCFITIVFIFAYLLKINRAIYYFILSSMTVVFYLVSKDLTMSICIAGVISALIYVFLDRDPLKKRKSMLFEHMTNEDKEDKPKDDKPKDDKPIPVDAKPKEDKPVPVEDKPKDDNDKEEFEPISEQKVDHKNSYLELFKSLKPAEISSLNTDTQQLIQTQKQLIETLQSMGPALKEGKTILDTFKNYFNDGGDKLSL